MDSLRILDQTEISSYNTVCLLSKSWWNSTQNSSGEGFPPISNQDLLEEDNLGGLRLKSTLKHNEDFLYIPPYQMDTLLKTHSGGPRIEVFIIQGIPDLHPVSLSAYCVTSVTEIYNSQPDLIFISLKISLSELKEHLCCHFEVRYADYELMIVNETGLNSLSEFEELALEVMGLMQGTRVCLKRREEVRPETLIPTSSLLVHRLRTGTGMSTGPSTIVNSTADENDEEVELEELRPALRELMMPTRADRDEVQQKIGISLSRPRVRLEIRSLKAVRKMVGKLIVDYQEEKYKHRHDQCS